MQIGKILGIEMYGTSSSEDKLARVRELGLQHGINYKQKDYAEAIKELTHGEGVDAVFEMLGGEHVAKSVKLPARFWACDCLWRGHRRNTATGYAAALYEGRERTWTLADLSQPESRTDGTGMEATIGVASRGEIASGDRESLSAGIGARRLTR